MSTTGNTTGTAGAPTGGQGGQGGQLVVTQPGAPPGGNPPIVGNPPGAGNPLEVEMVSLLETLHHLLLTHQHSSLGNSLLPQVTLQRPLILWPRKHNKDRPLMIFIPSCWIQRLTYVILTTTTTACLSLWWQYQTHTMCELYIAQTWVRPQLDRYLKFEEIFSY